MAGASRSPYSRIATRHFDSYVGEELLLTGKIPSSIPLHQRRNPPLLLQPSAPGGRG